MNSFKKETLSKFDSPFRGLGGITERLLQFIWQFQYFNKNELAILSGESVQIITAGNFNTNQGPDFQNAKIKVGKTIWVGNIELHVKTSDWKKHKHQADKNYKNVVLHVVWENDQAENSIPVVELKDRVAKTLLQRYEELMNSSAFIPCEKNIHSVKSIVWKSWKERLLAERLMRKAATAETFLRENNYHWEETFWWLLARNFGIKVNADAFEAIAKTISINVLAKHKSQLHQLEALLFGQAGLLNESDEKDDYLKLLQKEYKFLKQKLNLKPIHLPVHFLRMRPGNFPTIRLAQLAALVHQSSHLFSKIRETDSVKTIKNELNVTAGGYWNTHYRFGKTASFKKKQLGSAMVDNIIINTICPALFAFGNYHNENKYKDKALKWLEEISSEPNSITKGFQHLEIENKNAFDSQALIELKNEYCIKKKCLDCAVGNAILKS